MGRDAVNCTLRMVANLEIMLDAVLLQQNEALSASDRQAATSFSNALREMPTVVDHFKSTLEAHLAFADSKAAD